MTNLQRDQDNMPVFGIVLVLLSIIAPAGIFVGILENWNERHPVATLVLTVLIGVGSAYALVHKLEPDVRWKWIGLTAVLFVLYGLALAFLY